MKNQWSLDKLKGFNKNIQNNIEILYKTYGNKFTIKYNNKLIPVILDRIEYKNLKMKIFQLRYDDKRIDGLYPFSILFIDPLLFVKNNNTYINNIRKSDDLNGTEMVKLVLEINKTLSVNKTYLYDGTTISCGNNNYDLSFLKLIEKYHTFYMKFGFKYVPKSGSRTTNHFKSYNELNSTIVDIVNKIRKIKIMDIINEYNDTLNLLCDVIIKQDYDNLTIELSDLHSYVISPSIPTQKDDSKESIIGIMEECKIMLDLLSKYKHKKFLYLMCIDLFNDKEKCDMYDTVIKYIYANWRYLIKYKNKKITHNYGELFHYLSELRYEFIYCYEF